MTSERGRLLKRSPPIHEILRGRRVNTIASKPKRVTLSLRPRRRNSGKGCDAG